MPFVDILIAPPVRLFLTNSPCFPVPEPVIVPDALIVIVPAERLLATIPCPDHEVTLFALISIFPAAGLLAYIPAPPFPNTVAVAVIVRLPVPTLST